ncbi:MAG: hypothetical protein FGM58_11220, partial [Acidimicrobiia bacterium]|nr:hypothetical protein [Acidimicrobiia bacterium]
MRIRTLVLTLVVAAVTTSIASCSGAAGSSSATTRITLYAENTSLVRVDGNATGPDNGDLVHRRLSLSFSRGGPVIGSAWSQSEIVDVDTDTKVDLRGFDGELSLPEGWIFVRGMATLPIGTVPQPGWTDTYAVIGGTGAYEGARGTERLTLLDG